DRIARSLLRLLTAGFDVVDGARSRHRSAIEWFVGDESHEGSRPYANYHDRFGYREERVPGSRHRRGREGRYQEAASPRSGVEVFCVAAALPHWHGGVCHGALLDARIDEARPPGSADAGEGREGLRQAQQE